MKAVRSKWGLQQTHEESGAACRKRRRKGERSVQAPAALQQTPYESFFLAAGKTKAEHKQMKYLPNPTHVYN